MNLKSLMLFYAEPLVMNTNISANESTASPISAETLTDA